MDFDSVNVTISVDVRLRIVFAEDLIMSSTLRSLFLALCTTLLIGCGITGNLRGDPGYAPFESPGLFNTDRVFALSLGPVPLRLARQDDNHILKKTLVFSH